MGLNRREFATLAAKGLSAGVLLGNPAYLAATAKSLPDEALSESAESEPASDPEQSLSPAPDFMPDWTFQGSSLLKWEAVGNANWQAANGVIVGTPTQPSGGWLILSKSFQDVEFFARMRCAGACNAGVLLRLQRSATGMSGIFLSLRDGDFRVYRLTIDENGQELAREPLPATSDGPAVRFAFPSPQPEIRDTPLIEKEGREGEARGSQTIAGPAVLRGIEHPTPLPEIEPPPNGIWKDKWNEVEIIYDADVLRPFLNNTDWQIEAVATSDASDYGPIALYAGGADQVQFRDVSYKDLRNRKIDPESVSPNFRMQQLDQFYYGWGVAVADVNHDGHLDVITGPYYYLGPDFTERCEIYLAQSLDPSRQYTPNMASYAFDFHENGWPDVLTTETGYRMVLYVNPQDESRRWEGHVVVPQISSEITMLGDVDGDGRPELVYVTENTVMYAKYDPVDPTRPWVLHPVSEPGLGYMHGLGIGDIRGNGKMSILDPAGWWEQPPAGSRQKLWTYHPVAFGRCPRMGLVGGAQILVYDVNGDGLNDVVTSLEGHAWGLAWFEQKRDGNGNISFERHMIMDNFSTQNAGGVTFSELHALTLADVDGDGILDIVTGKRYWSHLDNYIDPYTYGPPVLYCYHTVRDPQAPGGARFVPELIHNRSGVGCQLATADLNNDGVVEIITATDRGNFIFWGRPRNKRTQLGKPQAD